jgi:antitoxin component YwqK of YwqJK toxin-antitoxin module
MIKNTLLIALVALFTLTACSDTDSKKDEQPVKKEVLFQIKDGHFTEWYEGKKQVKFEGDLDVKGNRDGKWTFYSEKGNMLSFTFYDHGKRDGYSVVKHPNGRIHYHGDYQNDKMVGVWTTYDEKGKNKQVKDYGYPESE